MSILSRLFGVNTTILKVKEAIGFNPKNVELIRPSAKGEKKEERGKKGCKIINLAEVK